MKFPLFKSTKIKELQKEIKDLENDFEEKFDEHMDYYLANKSLIGSDGANPFSDGFSTVDEQYDKSSLQKLFTTETWFHIAVSTIAQSIAALDFKLEKKKVVKQNVTQGNGESEEIFKEVWIDAGAEPEATIFKFPNEIQTRYDFWYNVVADLLATGDAFIFPMRSNLEESNSEDRLANAISRFRKTDVDALFRINSAMVEIVPSENPGEFIEKILVTSEEDTIEFGPDEIIHAKMPNPADPFYGLAPIVAVLKKLLLDRYSDESMIRFWKQGARLGGVIETSKNLTKEQMTRLTSTFEAKFTGKRQQHKTLILPNGMTYKPIEVSPVNTALIDFSKTNREAIMAVYKVPPIKIGLLDGATYANAMIQNKTFWTNAVMPIVSLLEASINKSELILKPMRNMRFKFDLSNVEALQEDYLAKAQSGEAMLKSGLLVNEVRELLWSLGPIEGGDYSPATKPAPSVNPLMLSAPKEESNQKVSEHHHIDSEGNQTGPAVDAGSGLHDHAQFDADGNVVGRTGAENNEPTHVHTDIYNRLTGGPKGGKQFTAPFSKEALVRYSKIVSGDGVSGLLEERKKEAEAFFKRLEAAIIGKIKRVPFRKTKGFGIKIALPSLEDIEFFINKELENIPESLLKASQHGYKANIPSSSIVFPN
nr:phage portal protein [Gammaproteobacteria bacterium]